MTLSRRNGFTLVEMVATIVIIALIAAVSGPLFFDLNIFKQRGFYEETLSAVRYAQKHAVASGCPVRVQTTATGFTLYRPATALLCASGPYDTVLADTSGKGAAFTRTAPDGVTLSAANFTFLGDGTAAPGNQTITFVGTGSAIQVFAATGYVGR